MRNAIADCEANISRLVDDLHELAESIKITTDPEDLQRLLQYRAVSQIAIRSEYDKLRRLQAEQAIIDVGGD